MPHECIVFQRKFSIKNNSNKHMRIYTEGKPYGCVIFVGKG